MATHQTPQPPHTHGPDGAPGFGIPGTGSRSGAGAGAGTRPVVYLLGAAAPPVRDIASVVELLQADGWDVCLGLTRTAAEWLAPYLPGLEALTGHPVRSRFGLPGEPDPWPEPDVVLLAPLTFHSLNAWALGLGGDFVTGYAALALGGGVPLVAAPCADPRVTAHPQWERSTGRLRQAGVHLLLDDARPAPWDAAAFPWDAALAAARRALPGAP